MLSIMCMIGLTTFNACHIRSVMSTMSTYISLIRWPRTVLCIYFDIVWVQNLRFTKRIYSWSHYNDVIMSMIVSQITSVSIVCSTVYSGTDRRKHQSSASLAFVRGIHWWPVDSPHKGKVRRKMFPLDDVIVLKMPVPYIDVARTWPLLTVEKSCHLTVGLHGAVPI